MADMHRMVRSLNVASQNACGAARLPRCMEHDCPKERFIDVVGAGAGEKQAARRQGFEGADLEWNRSHLQYHVGDLTRTSSSSPADESRALRHSLGDDVRRDVPSLSVPDGFLLMRGNGSIARTHD